MADTALALYVVARWLDRGLLGRGSLPWVMIVEGRGSDRVDVKSHCFRLLKDAVEAINQVVMVFV